MFRYLTGECGGLPKPWREDVDTWEDSMAIGKIEITTTYTDNSSKPVNSVDVTLPGTLEGSANATETRVRYSG